MSEVYEFKNLSDAEAMAEPSENTTVLALDGGAVKQIPANKLGGGGFLINMTMSVLNMTVTSCDKTFTEITDAAKKGLAPVAFCLVDEMEGAMGFYAPLSMYRAEGLYFCATMGTGYVTAFCAADNTWTLASEGL